MSLKNSTDNWLFNLTYFCLLQNSKGVPMLAMPFTLDILPRFDFPRHNVELDLFFRRSSTLLRWLLDNFHRSICTPWDTRNLLHLPFFGNEKYPLNYSIYCTLYCTVKYLVLMSMVYGSFFILVHSTDRIFLVNRVNEKNVVKTLVNITIWPEQYVSLRNEVCP